MPEAGQRAENDGGASTVETEEKPFPKLGGFPETPRPSSVEQRERLSEELVADRTSAGSSPTPGDTASGAAVSSNHEFSSPAPMPGAMSLQLATIQFAPGSTAIGDLEIEILRQVGQVQKQRGGRLRVLGHASQRDQNLDADGRRRVNDAMSLERAVAVGRQLELIGVPRERIAVAGLSDSQPLYEDGVPYGEAGNQRVEIYID